MDNEEPRYPVMMNAFEQGVLLGLVESIGDHRKLALKNVCLQIIDYKKKFEEQAGVTRKLLPNGLIQLTDRDGVTVVRAPYSWEV